MSAGDVEPVRVARWCAGRGYPVFPLAPGRKTPMRGCERCSQQSAGYVPHPPQECACLARGGLCHGFYAATLDADLIEHWWAVAGRGVAVSTGPAQLVVVDVDRHSSSPPSRAEQLLPGVDLTPEQVAAVKDGPDVLRLLARTRGQADPTDGGLTMTVRTPSGGLHLWFRAPARTAWRGSAGGDHQGPVLGWQLDVRARGGYIVAPGTRTEAGTYEVVGPCREPVLLPSWLAGELTRTGHLLPSVADRVRPESPVPNRARAAASAARWGSAGQDPGRWAERTAVTVLEAVADCRRVPEGAGWSGILNRAAFTLGGLVAGAHITEEAAHTALLDAALIARPTKKAVALGIIRSGLAAGKRRALHPKDER
ncbi:bifunctional DNA primase/polymerase [Streptomyces graminilatus]|uniref:bifunctional DNA primase/polymerase n=1 Tax=Streptomyces graminilatus TaxID=1464070 RepID=UPI000ACE5A37|nr:bifunctional DNA primase/polymerase [Streptomyces graminilatus]